MSSWFTSVQSVMVHVPCPPGSQVFNQRWFMCHVLMAHKCSISDGSCAMSSWFTSVQSAMVHVPCPLGSQLFNQRWFMCHVLLVHKCSISDGSCAMSSWFTSVQSAMVGTKVLKLDWWPLTRDCLMYGITVVVLILTLNDERVEWYEALMLVSMYILYISGFFDDILYLAKQNQTKRSHPIRCYFIAAPD
uniref:Uncharacterized protein n=1 Tax=Timema monikensis TaxID=170555 RepID=A0A7R9E553_9NEOP|nr:unnamed protein product [Timema monikensis]